MILNAPISVTTVNPSGTSSVTLHAKTSIASLPDPYALHCPYVVDTLVPYSCTVGWTGGVGQLGLQFGADPQVDFNTTGMLDDLEGGASSR
jgi:hypothetical protein